ncbi:MAG: hypothetical protein WBK91_05840 [Alphaproteobacteria bacterium]
MIDNENQDQFDQPVEFDEGGDGSQKGNQLKNNVVEAWRTRPIFKLLVLIIAVGALVAALIGFLSPKPEISASHTSHVPVLVEAPGGKASPAFIEAQQKANQQRIQEAAQVEGSAIPTPLPTGMGLDARKDQADPLVQFRAEMEKQRDEQRRQIQALQQQSQQQQQLTLQQDQQLQERLAQIMQTQMGQLFELWKPKGMQVVGGVEDEREKERLLNATGNASQNGRSTSSRLGAEKIPPVVIAGTVSYAQLLTTANSDAEAPILAQILSGPLSGARAIGGFKTEYDFLVMKFTLATLKNKEYRINAIAIDPETTLPALATEVDHRYFTRVILPAAASFVGELGRTLGQKPVNSSITTGGVVITEQARSGIKDGLYAGMGAAGESISNFFKSEANRTKVMVEVASGTPIGLMFVESVCPGDFPCSLSGGEEPAQALLAPGLAANSPAAQALQASNAANAALQQAAGSGQIYPVNQAYPGGAAGGGRNNVPQGGYPGYPNYPGIR